MATCRRGSPPAAAAALAAWLWVLVLCFNSSVARGYNILIYPLGERTHMLVHLHLAGELMTRGHAVAVLAPGCHQQFAEATVARTHPAAAQQLRYIPYDLDCAFVERDKQRAATASPLHGIWMILEALAKRTDAVMSDADLVRRLRGMRGEVDLMVADPLAYGGLLAHQLDLPHVDLDVGTAGSLMEPFIFGATAAPAYIPTVGTFLPTNGMSLLQRAANAAVAAGAHALMHFVYYNDFMWVRQMVRKHSLNATVPYVKPLLLLVNSNFVLEPPRPVAPQTKYVGPMLPAPARPVPAEFEAWLQGAGPLGVVLVSFGGTLNAPLAASRTVLAAMARLPDVRFVWKLTPGEQQQLAADLEGARNVMVRDWVPQNDLLGHPRVRGFVTQGGYLSMSEAAFHGVPIVGLPFIAGQGELVRYAADQGRGLLLHKDTLRRGDHGALAAALLRVLTEGSFEEAAATASLRLRAAPQPYRQQAAEWVEYAARVKDAGPFLYTQGQLMAWWQVMMLDVAAVMALGLGLAAWGLRRWSARRRAAAAEAELWPEAEIVLQPMKKVQ